MGRPSRPERGLGRTWAALLWIAACGPIVPHGSTGAPGRVNYGGGAGNGSAASDGGARDGSVPDGSVPDASFFDADGGATPAGCVSCNPSNPNNGGCPSGEICSSQIVQGGGSTNVCADSQGNPHCAFCSPSIQPNGGCASNETCTVVPNPQNGVMYVCEGAAPADAG